MRMIIGIAILLGCTFITIYPPGGGMPQTCQQCCTGGMCTIMCATDDN